MGQNVSALDTTRKTYQDTMAYLRHLVQTNNTLPAEDEAHDSIALLATTLSSLPVAVTADVVAFQWVALCDKAASSHTFAGMMAELRQLPEQAIPIVDVPVSHLVRAVGSCRAEHHTEIHRYFTSSVRWAKELI
jgi:hypothetical protein